MVTYLIAAVLAVCFFAVAWWLGVAVVVGAVLIFTDAGRKAVSR